MPQLLIFLGAGASKAFANIPTMKEMVDLFEEEIREEKDMLRLYSSVVDALKDMYPERIDLEAVFTVLNGIATGRTLRDLGFLATYEAKRLGVTLASSVDPETQTLAKRLLKKYEEFIASSAEIKEGSKANLFELYRMFSEIPPPSNKQKVSFEGHDLWWSGQWAVYTTNYDLCIETICSDAGIEIQRGSYFDSRINRRILRPDYTQTGTNLGSDNVFKIVKLHGSLSWYRRKDGLELEYSEGVPTRDLLQGRIMLYPLEEKALYEEPYILLVNYFRQDLKLAPKWLFIGYRFNDPFLLRIIEYCSRTGKSIGVIHPDATNLINTKLDTVLGSKQGFDAKFDDLVMGRSNQLEDFRKWLGR